MSEQTLIGRMSSSRRAKKCRYDVKNNNTNISKKLDGTKIKAKQKQNKTKQNKTKQKKSVCAHASIHASIQRKIDANGRMPADRSRRRKAGRVARAQTRECCREVPVSRIRPCTHP